MGIKMKKILLFFALPFFMISCFSEAFSGEEDAQCGDGTFVCRQDACAPRIWRLNLARREAIEYRK